jgi:hypothetical protein
MVYPGDIQSTHSYAIISGATLTVRESNFATGNVDIFSLVDVTTQGLLTVSGQTTNPTSSGSTAFNDATAFWSGGVNQLISSIPSYNYGTSIIGDLNTSTDVSFSNPGYYFFNTDLNIFANSLTFHGSATDVFVFQASNINFVRSFIFLSGGIPKYNIIWLASDMVTITHSGVIGNIFASTCICESSRVDGLVYSNTTIELLNTTIAAPDYGIPCYVKGSKILTTSGYVAVEDLRVGDSVPTFGTITDVFTPEESVRKIKWIGKLVPVLYEKTRPIRIKKEAFPDLTEDLCVSPGHALIVNNKLICARDLVNGTTIIPDDCTEVTYYHIELDTYSAVKANGILAETYLSSSDTRVIFESIV